MPHDVASLPSSPISEPLYRNLISKPKLMKRRLMTPDTTTCSVCKAEMVVK
ncbi:hypothetical protein AAVH_33288, partial [Aphelenchoides avenae]